MARSTAARKPAPAIADPVSIGGTPGSPNVGQAPTTGTRRMLKADATREYLAGLPRGGAGTWYLNLARSLAASIDDLTEHVGDEVYERMLHDPQVAASLNVFKAAVLETGPSFSPALDDEDDPDYARAVFLADWCTAIFADLTTSIDDILWNLADGFALGNKVGELIFGYSDQYWAVPSKKPAPKYGPHGEKLPPAPAPARLPQGSGPQLVLKDIKVKPRESIGFLVDAYSNVLGLLGHIPGQYYPIQPGMVYADISRIPNLLPLDKFVVLTFRPKDADPRGTSILRPAHKAWDIKQQLWAQYGMFLSQMAGGMIVGKPDPAAVPEQIQDAAGQPTGQVATPEEALLQTLLAAKNGAVLVVQPGADVAVQYPISDGSAFLQAFELLNLEITKAILHVTLATEEGKHQARAAAEVHADVLQIMIRAAKGSVERLLRGILQRLVAYNYGDEARRMVPNVSLGETDSADQSKLWTAVAALMTSGYFTADQLPVLDGQIGLPVRLPTDPDDLATQQAPPQALPGTTGVPGQAHGITSAGGTVAVKGTDAGLRPEESPTPHKPSVPPPKRQPGTFATSRRVTVAAKPSAVDTALVQVAYQEWARDGQAGLWPKAM